MSSTKKRIDDVKKVYIATLSPNASACEVQAWDVVKICGNGVSIVRGNISRHILKTEIGFVDGNCFALIDEDEAEEAIGLTEKEALDVWRAQYIESAKRYERLARKCRKLANLPAICDV